MPQHHPHPVPEGPGVLVPIEVRGWQKGYDAGISSPPDVPEAPSVRHPGFMLAWAEGAAAGNADGRMEGWRWAYFEERPFPQPGGAGTYEPHQSGEAEGGFARSWPCVGEGPLRVMLARFAAGEEAEEGLVGRALARACADRAVARLYLPVLTSRSAPAAEPTGDPLTDAGYWHGSVCESMAEAAPQARPKLRTRAPHFGAVVRYTPAAGHHFFDLLPLDGQLPDRG